MRVGKARFEVDRGQGKLLGVCAGIANHVGVDVTIVRVVLVVATLMGGWPWTAVAYGVAALVGRQARHAARPRLALSGEESRERMRSLDLRMQAIETCAASSNSRLAREIEQLR